MKIVSLETVVKWIQTTTKFPQYKTNYPLMAELYENEFPDHFVLQSTKLNEGSMYFDGEEGRIINTIQGKIIEFALWKGLSFISKTRFGWSQDSYYAGLNEGMLKAALVHNIPIKIVSKMGEFLKKPTLTKSGIKAPLYATQDAMIQSIENDWIIKTTWDDLKIFAIPIYLMPRSYDVVELRNQKQLSDFSQTA